MNELIILRLGGEIGRVKIDKKTILTKKLMNEDKVTAQFNYPSVLPLQLGDYIEVGANKYFINQLPSIQKIKNITFKYNVTFESDLYELYNKILISIDGLSDFSYTGNAQEMLELIVNNINEISSGWAVGTVDDTQKKTTTFTNESCRSALTRVSAIYNFEFEVIGKTINLVEAIGNNTNHVFEYGKGSGLYSIERRQIQNKAVFTKVYGFGSEKNLSFDYRNRQKRLVFEERYLERNTAIYGVREGQYTNEDIFPQRTGTLSAVNNEYDAEDWNATSSYVEDTSIDFNLNEYLLEGIVAKIVFKSGNLSGSEFEIWKYDDDTNRIYFNVFGDSDGYVSPNLDVFPEVGDTYTLVNIKMPQSYIAAAELLLKEETQRFIDANSVPKTLYFVKIDSKYAKANSISIDAGDLVTVKDIHLGIDSAIRISQVSWPLVNPFEISAVIADFIPYSLQELFGRNVTVTNKAITQIVNQITQVNNTINNNTTVNETYQDTVIIEHPEKGVVTIGGRKFWYKKAFDNPNPEILEAGDTISGNWFNRYEYVNKWEYLGGVPKELPENWEKIETTIIDRGGTPISINFAIIDPVITTI